MQVKESMTPRERVRTAMGGGTADRVPVFPVITYMHTSRILKKNIREFVLDPDLNFRAAVEAWRYYRYDGFELGFSRPRGSEPVRWSVREGMEVLLDGAGNPYAQLPPDDMPVPLRPEPPLVRSIEDVEKIPVTPASHYIDSGMLEGAAYVRRETGGGAYLAGVAAGQTMNSLVQFLGTEQALMALAEQPELAEAVMDRATDATIEQAKAWRHADVDGIYFGDAWSSSSIISPAMFREFCLPRYRRFVREVHALGLQCYLHICGNSTPILELMADTGADGIEPLDPLGGVSVADAKSRVGGRVCLKGGINTLTFLKSGDELYREARAVLEQGAPGGGFLLGSGDDIPRDALPEAVCAMVRAAEEYRY